MGPQLGINKSFDIIVSAIKATGEIFDRDFYHVHSVPGNFVFFVEIADKTLEREISAISKAYSDDEYVFALNIPSLLPKCSTWEYPILDITPICGYTIFAKYSISLNPLIPISITAHS